MSERERMWEVAIINFDNLANGTEGGNSNKGQGAEIVKYKGRIVKSGIVVQLYAMVHER